MAEIEQPKLQFEYMSNGVEYSDSRNIENTYMQGFIIDASNKYFITHLKAFPFMRLTNDYIIDSSKSLSLIEIFPNSITSGDIHSGERFALSQKGAMQMYYDISALIDLKFNNISELITSDVNPNHVIDTYQEIKNFLAGIDDVETLKDIYADRHKYDDKGISYDVLYSDVLKKVVYTEHEEVLLPVLPDAIKVRITDGVYNSVISPYFYKYDIPENTIYTGEYALEYMIGESIYAKVPNNANIIYGTYELYNGSITGPATIYVPYNNGKNKTITIISKLDIKEYGIVYENQLASEISKLHNELVENASVFIEDNNAIHGLLDDICTNISTLLDDTSNINASIKLINTNVNEQFTQLQTEYLTKISNVENYIFEHDEALAYISNDLNSKISDLYQKVNNISFSGVNGEITELSERLDIVEAYIIEVSTDLHNQLIELSTNFNDQLTETSSYFNDLLIELSTNLTDLSTNLNGQLTETSSYFNGQLTELSTNLTETSSYFNELLTESSSYFNGQLTELSTNLTDLSTNLNGQLTESSSYFKGQLTELSTNLTDVSNRLNTLENAMSDLIEFDNLLIDISTEINNLKETNLKNELVISTALNELYDLDTSLLNLLNIIQDSNNTIQTQLNVIDNTLFDVSSAISNNTKDISNLCKIVDEVSTALSNIDENVSTAIQTSLSNVKYAPSDDIPDTYKSTVLGNLSASEKQNLKDRTFSELFDEILFKDINPTINYNENSNYVTVTDVEYGTIILESMLTAHTGLVSYSYSGSNTINVGQWVASPFTFVSETLVASTLGTYHIGSCTFTYTKPDITLTTAMGKTTTVLLTNKTKNTSIDVATYVKLYYINGVAGATHTLSLYINNTFTLITNKETLSCVPFTLLTSLNNTTGTTLVNYKSTLLTTSTYLMCGEWKPAGLTSSSYVFVIIPEILKINKVYIRNGLTGSPDEITTFGVLTAEQISNAGFTSDNNSIKLDILSSLNKYNVWYIAKSETNSDGTVSPNAEPLKIQIIKK